MRQRWVLSWLLVGLATLAGLLSSPARADLLADIGTRGRLASSIALPELVHVSTAIVAERGNTVVMMNLLMICHFLIVLAVVAGFHRLQKRLEASA